MLPAIGGLRPNVCKGIYGSQPARTPPEMSYGVQIPWKLAIYEYYKPNRYTKYFNQPTVVANFHCSTAEDTRKIHSFNRMEHLR